MYNDPSKLPQHPSLKYLVQYVTDLENGVHKYKQEYKQFLEHYNKYVSECVLVQYIHLFDEDDINKYLEKGEAFFSLDENVGRTFQFGDFKFKRLKVSKSPYNELFISTDGVHTGIY